MDELVEKWCKFLETHNVFVLMELVTAAVATKEMANSGQITVYVDVT